MKRPNLLISTIAWGLLAVPMACSEPEVFSQSDTDTSGDSDADTDSDSDSDSDGNGTDWSEEGTECDGIDNDGNGIIDDIDLDGDGVCDCLRVGTFGAIGQWGDGNVFGQWLAERSSIPVVVLGDQVEITPAAIENLQVLAIQDFQAHAWSTSLDWEAQADILYDWVVGGGGLIVLTGYEGTVPEENITNKLISRFNVHYRADEDFFGYQYNPDHPECEARYVEMPTDSHNIFHNVEIVGINTGNVIEASDGETIATDSSGKIIAQTLQVGAGKVFFFCDEWITFDATWSDETCSGMDVEQFWINIFAWVTPEDECQLPPV